MKSKRMITLGLSAMLFVSLAGTALAGPRGQIVNMRQHRQDHRIMQGLRSGELTRPEARKLLQGQRQINHYERVARADGHISPREYRKLDRMQDRQNARIYREKHDNQERRF